MLVLVSRFLAILCFKSFLSKFGYGLKLAESFVVAFAGLKGAVAISYSMIIFENDSYSDKTSNYFLMHVAANSLLTLLINGMSTWIMIKHLRISTITKVEYKFYKEYL